MSTTSATRPATVRELRQVIPGLETSDGAGVKLRRSIGANANLRLDPFLMLDEFGTDNADDYISGFPSHPHRGFETVTYMLDGRMQHKDHLGNVGDLGPGSVQWMTAGRGVVHSEMPQQESGRMRGFQLWINLPAREKMKPAHYRDIPATDVPVATLANGGSVKVIAGTFTEGKTHVSGPVNSTERITTDPLYLDVSLPIGASFTQAITPDYNAFVYVYEGEVSIGRKRVPRYAAGILGPGSEVIVKSEGTQPARFILLAAKPLKEPVVQYGPFVMNTREEIEQTLRDYQTGEFLKSAA